MTKTIMIYIVMAAILMFLMKKQSYRVKAYVRNSIAAGLAGVITPVICMALDTPFQTCYTTVVFFLIGYLLREIRLPGKKKHHRKKRKVYAR